MSTVQLYFSFVAGNAHDDLINSLGKFFASVETILKIAKRTCALFSVVIIRSRSAISSSKSPFPIIEMPDMSRDRIPSMACRAIMVGRVEVGEEFEVARTSKARP